MIEDDSRDPAHLAFLCELEMLCDALGREISGAEPPKENSIFGGLKWFAGNATGLVALAAILSYALLGNVDQAFYHHLGTTPAEVGIDRIAMLSAAAFFLAIFVAGCLAVVAGLGLLGWRRHWSVLAFLLVVTAGAVWVLHSRFAGWVVFVLVVAVVTTVFGLWCLYQAGRSAHPPRSQIAFGSLGILVFVGLFLWALWFGHSRGIGLADDALRKDAVGQLTFLAVRAAPVCAEWTGTGEPSVFVGTQLFAYLGQSDGTMLLLDYNLGRPVRLPAGDVVLTPATLPPEGNPGPPTCP